MKPNGNRLVRKGFRKAPEGSKRPVKARKAPSVLRSLRNKTWELCKAITRLRWGNVCYTCGKTGLAGSSWQTGHFIARSVGGLSLKYHLDNLRPQCYMCNIDLSGNGAVFYRKLVEVEGQAYVDNLFALKAQTIKETKDFYYDLIAEYKKILAETQPRALLAEMGVDKV